MKNGSATMTSYWLMPESALDDPDEARDFATIALGAARRAKARKGTKATSTRKALKKTRKTASEPAT